MGAADWLDAAKRNRMPGPMAGRKARPASVRGIIVGRAEVSAGEVHGGGGERNPKKGLFSAMVPAVRRWDRRRTEWGVAGRGRRRPWPRSEALGLRGPDGTPVGFKAERHPETQGALDRGSAHPRPVAPPGRAGFAGRHGATGAVGPEWGGSKGPP